MKYSTLLLVTCATLGGCASGSYDPFSVPRNSSLSVVASYASSVKRFLASGTPEDAIKKAQEAVANSLKDPGSAQFRNVRLKPYLDGQVVCGEVNGKNSYGGYVGFSPFVASTNSATLYVREKWTELEYAYNAGINSAC